MPAATPSDSTTSAIGATEWEKPGPGSWVLDLSHYEADCAAISREVIEVGMRDGMAEGFDVMGGPIKGLEAVFVNGHFYRRMVPLIGGDKDLPVPPAPVLWLATRLHPTFRRRSKQASATLRNRSWNDELRKWRETDRPWLTDRCRTLAANDPTTMTDEELVAHLEDVIDLLYKGTTLHFRLHVSDLAPIGLLLVKAREWGLDQVKTMATLAGASPATSAPKVALTAIAGAAAGHGQFASLDQVRAVSPEVATMLDEFLEIFGWRLTTGYDLQELSLLELPELILTGINQALDGTNGDLEGAAKQAGDAAADELRAQLQPRDRDEFDLLVEDARALYGLRDENGPLTYQWPAGLLRRAQLEAARRLVATNRLTDEQHVFDLGGDELVSVLQGGATPTAAELGERAAQRRRWKTLDAPMILGRDEEPPPSWTLPKPLAQMMDVITTVIDLIETDGTSPELQGIGIGDEPYVGKARVVADEIDALTRMEPGDVLIAPFTVPTYNAVLASAGAVVVENGGLLCHAAVIAREYGIPGLVGVSGATTQISDGAMVRIDPESGTIRELHDDAVSL